MNIPNALTVSRLVAIPVLMALLLMRFPGHDQVAAALFILFSLTDTFDGQIARRRGLVSDFGKFLDPLADKLFVLSVLIVLVQESLVAAWVVVIIFSRELIITILRSVGASQGRVIAAAPLGKTKTITQMSAVVLLILQRPYPELVPFAGVAVAESSTGGMLGSMLTEVPGSSAYFQGGVIAYSNEAKQEQLGVPRELLERLGAVSREVAEAMAEGVRGRFRTDLAAAITGIAGPGAGGTTKPVGLTYIAVASQRGPSSRELKFTGDRAANRRQAALEALDMLMSEARAISRAGGK